MPKGKCDYDGCISIIAKCESVHPGKQFCNKHKKEMRDAFKMGGKSVIRFWIKSSGGAQKLAESMAPAVEVGSKLFTTLRDGGAHAPR